MEKLSHKDAKILKLLMVLVEKIVLLKKLN